MSRNSDANRYGLQCQSIERACENSTTEPLIFGDCNRPRAEWTNDLCRVICWKVNQVFVAGRQLTAPRMWLRSPICFDGRNWYFSRVDKKIYQSYLCRCREFSFTSNDCAFESAEIIDRCRHFVSFTCRWCIPFPCTHRSFEYLIGMVMLGSTSCSGLFPKDGTGRSVQPARLTLNIPSVKSLRDPNDLKHLAITKQIALIFWATSMYMCRTRYTKLLSVE